MAEFRMPSLGADMEEGTLVEWLVKPGDRLKRGDIIAVVETRKGAIEVEIHEAGRVERLLVPEGTKVPVGTLLALLGEAEVSIPPPPEPLPSPAPAPPLPLVPASAPLAPPSSPPVALRPEPASVLPTASAPPPAAEPRAGWIRSSPAARHRARERDVEHGTVEGTGPHGAIRRGDVERAAAARPPIPRPPPITTPPPAPEAVAPAHRPGRADPTEMRAAIAEAMSRSNREIPHYYLGQSIDLHRATTWLSEHNRDRPPTRRVLPAALLIKATALAIRAFPELNGFCVDGRYTASKGVHPGIAISLRTGGLVTPAIHDADTLDLDSLMAALFDLVQRARAGRLRASELSDPTLTITNLGEGGVETVFGVILPPQVALVGFGRVTDRPWAVDGMLTIRPIVAATLAADHRVSDGHRGALFLTALDHLLQEPGRL
jgi:pyruvate dehydrogenase E2 component (dihydrolipoamide acetyltransferase)